MSLFDVVTGGTFKLYSLVVFLTVIVASVGGLYWYVTSLQSTVEKLQTDNKTLSSIVDTQKATITGIQKDIALGRAMQDELRLGVQNNYKDLKTLENKFKTNAAGKPRDFGGIASKEPAQVAKLVNKGVENANRCLELASGAPITDRERNAKLKSEINSICPSLAHPNYKPVN